MPLSGDEIETRTRELDKIANNIEDLVVELFSSVETHGWFSIFGRLNIYEWRSPDEEAKQVQRDIQRKYEKWTASVKPLVERRSPENVEKFKKRYKSFKEIVGLDDGVVVPKNPKSARADALDAFHDQQNMVNNILNKIDLEPLLEAGTDEQKFNPPTELFDDELISQCLEQYNLGNFQSAIQNAFIVLEERIRKQGDLPQDKVGRELAQMAFEPDSGPLRFGATGAERAGAKNLYVGAIMTYRNPSSHRFKSDLDRKQSYNILCLVNLLLMSISDDLE